VFGSSKKAWPCSAAVYTVLRFGGVLALRMSGQRWIQSLLRARGARMQSTLLNIEFKLTASLELLRAFKIKRDVCRCCAVTCSVYS
jgi:hypothetical protein